MTDPAPIALARSRGNVIGVRSLCGFTIRRSSSAGELLARRLQAPGGNPGFAEV